MTMLRSPAFKSFRRLGIDVNDPNLVLYLPFSDPSMSGDNLISRDIYRRATTVTGAIQQVGGRLTDGIDDKMSVPDSDAWDFGTGAFTINLWMKNPTADTGTVIGHGGYGYTTADDLGWSLRFRGIDFRWLYYHTPGVTARDALSFEYTGALWGSGFRHISLIRDVSSNIRMLVDGVQIGTTQASAADVTLGAFALRIAVSRSDYEAGWQAGTYGSVTILKGKGWTDAENGKDYLATKARYQ